MKRLISLAGLLVLLGSGCLPAESEFTAWFKTPEQNAIEARRPTMGPAREAHESASIVLPKRHLQRFLQIVAVLMDEGFNYRQIRRVRDMAAKMGAGDEESLIFPVTFQRRGAELEIQIYLDDPEAMVVYFFSLPELIDLIDEQTVKFTAAMLEWDEQYRPSDRSSPVPPPRIAGCSESRNAGSPHRPTATGQPSSPSP